MITYFVRIQNAKGRTSFVCELCHKECIMRVLVTGHNGYVGSLKVPILLESGNEEVGLDTNLYRGSTFGDI